MCQGVLRRDNGGGQHDTKWTYWHNMPTPSLAVVALHFIAPIHKTLRITPAVPIERVQNVNGLRLDAAAEQLGVSRSTLKRWRRQVQQSPSDAR